MVDQSRRIQTKTRSLMQHVEDFFTIVHNEFLGSVTHYTKVAQEEFLLMKCCSFEWKDLEKHFDRMSRRYYSFNGMDDVNAKHTFLNSLLEPLGGELFA